jgi:integrase/recombinase XerD
MNKAQQKRYQSLYQEHLSALRRQGKSKTTIDVYARAVRRITEYFDRFVGNKFEHTGEDVEL